MTPIESISDEQLNALLDSQMVDADSARLLETIRSDKALASHYCELRHLKDMVKLAYNNPPVADNTGLSFSGMAQRQHFSLSVAAMVLVLLGGIVGWFINSTVSNRHDVSFYTVDRLNPGIIKSNRVLLHIESFDERRVDATLSKVEELLRRSAAENAPIEVEVVANSDGLNILRKGSPYVNRIKSIAAKYDNVSFMACGVARQNARLREGKEIALIPEATEVPAALDQILKRLKSGWTYVRG